MASHVFPVDPATLGRIAARQQIDGTYSAEHEVPACRVRELHRLIEGLRDPFERDVARMHYEHGMTQYAIALVFGMSQAAISYRIRRVRWRLEWERVLPRLPDSLDQWHRDLDDAYDGYSVRRLSGFRFDVIEMLHACWDLRCIAQAADRIGLTAHLVARGKPAEHAAGRLRPVLYSATRRLPPGRYATWFSTMREHRLWARLSTSPVMAQHREECRVAEVRPIEG